MKARKRLTVFQLISSEGLYGAESMMVNLCEGLAQLGCDVLLGIFEDGRCAHTEVATMAVARGLKVRLLPCRSRWDWSTIRLIRREVESNQVEVLHTHGYKADVYSYLASRGRSSVLVASCHGWPPGARILRLYAAVDRLALKAFDELATMSPEVAGILMSSGISPSKITFIPNGIDPSRFERNEPTLKAGIPNMGRSLVGLVSRMVPGKGVPILLQAARQVLAIDPDVSFVFVGDGPARKEFESMAEEIGIARRVFFTGRRNDMPDVYAALDILVLPSAKESMPMAILEAMSSGKPVIATPVGAVPELVIHEKTGYLVPVGDVEALAAYILRLVRDPQLAARMGRAACEHIRVNFSLAATARNYLSLYHKALERRTRQNTCVATIHQV